MKPEPHIRTAIALRHEAAAIEPRRTKSRCGRGCEVGRAYRELQGKDNRHRYGQVWGYRGENSADDVQHRLRRRISQAVGHAARRAGLISAGDVTIALSNSGETDEILALLPTLRQREIPIIAIVGNVTSTLARRSGCRSRRLGR